MRFSIGGKIDIILSLGFVVYYFARYETASKDHSVNSDLAFL